MLRPATPLSVLLFAAFCLLLLSSLSAPIISAIPLGQWMGVDFGVFGFCNGGSCTPIEIGYDVRKCYHVVRLLAIPRLLTISTQNNSAPMALTSPRGHELP